ncbi:unnamed protein product [Pleuronectes platessa]|uniref:Uncharacterized protein n=1 Tax=Pleuronectes platessa TaxID=8262 RepID=A0A9N7YYZ9_PLEPL|nr:unnamed protein product [Pleuronectes platessa]
MRSKCGEPDRTCFQAGDAKELLKRWRPPSNAVSFSVSPLLLRAHCFQERQRPNKGEQRNDPGTATLANIVMRERAFDWPEMVREGGEGAAEVRRPLFKEELRRTRGIVKNTDKLERTEEYGGKKCEGGPGEPNGASHADLLTWLMREAEDEANHS